MAQFRIDQVTPGAGTPGRARHDLVAGEVITLVAISPAGPGVTYAWEILDKVGSAATLSSPTGGTVTIGNAGLIQEPCAFLIQLTVNDNGDISVEKRVASVRTTTAGLRVPVFPESAPASGKLSANTPDLSHDNAYYADRAGTGVAGQNWRGWAEWAYELTMAVETIAISAGGGSASGDLSGTYPGPITVVGFQGVPASASTPLDGDVWRYNGTSGEWEPYALSVGTSLQLAYNGGNTINETLNGVLITSGGSMLVNYAFRVNANAGPTHGVMVQKDPLTPTGGTAVNLYMGASATGNAVEVSHLGSGHGISIATTGSGDALRIDTTSGTGHGITALVASGMRPFQSQINGQNAFTVDGTAASADFGSSSAPLLIVGHSTARMGAAAGATAKTFELFTTDAGTTPSSTNKLGRLITREGTRTSTMNVAELAFVAGSAGEVLITKGGQVFAPNTLVELPIENGVTIAAGQAVNVSNVAGRVSLANAGAANEYLSPGICLVGGTGDAGGTVYALFAQTGVVTGLSGLTAQRPVYLDPTTPGAITTTKPVTGTLVVIGFSLSTTSMIVQFALPPPDASGGSDKFVFQPGGVASGNVYDTWSALYADASAVPCPTVEIDTTYGPAQLPSGTYDFAGWTFKSRSNQTQAQLTWLDGAEWTPLMRTTLTLVNVSFNTDSITSTPITAADGINLVLGGEVGSQITGDATHKFIDVTAAMFSQPNVTVYLTNSRLNAYALTVDNSAVGSTLNVYVIAYGRSVAVPLSIDGICDGFDISERSSYANLGIFPSLTAASPARSNTGGVRKDIVVSKEVVGDVAESIGMIRLPESSVIVSAYAILGATSDSAHIAHLDIVRRTGGTVVGSWEVTGAPVEATLTTPTPPAPIEIPADDWYEFKLYADDTGQVALCQGIHLIVYSATVPQ